MRPAARRHRPAPSAKMSPGRFRRPRDGSGPVPSSKFAFSRILTNSQTHATRRIARGPGSRVIACDAEESPGSMKQGWRVTPAGGDPRESATENRPPNRALCPAARVKRCGKSAPRAPVTAAARQTPPGARPNRGDAPVYRQAGFKPRVQRPCVARVGCLSAAAMRRLEEWLPVPIRSVRYGYRRHDRTRLTGPLAHCI